MSVHYKYTEKFNIMNYIIYEIQFEMVKILDKRYNQFLTNFTLHNTIL